jgi:hypothetical protein
MEWFNVENLKMVEFVWNLSAFSPFGLRGMLV